MHTPPLVPHHHVGVIVADLESARRELTELLGLRWGPVMHLDAQEVHDAERGPVELPTTICYSVESPHIELIQEVPGTVWARNEHSNLHHLGFWSDDLPATSAGLSGSGCPLQLCGRSGGDAPVSFAYHGTPLGVRVEVLDAGLRDAMSFLFQPQD